MATVIQFPGPAPRRLKARPQRGTVEWAVAVSRDANRATRKRVEIYQKLKSIQRRDLPMPHFKTTAPGYQGMNCTQAKHALFDRLPDVGPAEQQLIADMKAYAAARTAWGAAYRELWDNAAYIAAQALELGLRDAHCEAAAILMDHRINPFRL